MTKLKKYLCQQAGGELIVTLPDDANVLDFANQSGTIFCYALTQGSAISHKKTFLALRADSDTKGLPFISTIKKGNVLHIFGPM